MFRPASALKIDQEDQRHLQLLAHSGKTPQRNALRARIVLAAAEGHSNSSIARTLKITRPTVLLWRARFRDCGVPGLLKAAEGRGRKRTVAVEAVKSAIFTLLHSPPSQHSINRTSWNLASIRECMLRQGIPISRTTISRIVAAAGYKWRKAIESLTSNDSQYQEKLERIKSILSTLSEKDRFCSIDEFGPFAVKMKGGTKLVGPDEHPHVPQFQKSKGCLIVTAALELSRNQVTHFYSKTKNTTEVIRLLEVLLEQYRGCDKLYLSWDAATWHASKELKEKVQIVNTPHYRKANRTPQVELVPLPKSAQYLNVIEAVFSGMARAIIHNSNYQSVEEATTAIDRYFQERNEYFRKNPKRAGRKIWGEERVVCKFSESNNCKDPKYR
jgi:transposase